MYSIAKEAFEQQNRKSNKVTTIAHVISIPRNTHICKLPSNDFNTAYISQSPITWTYTIHCLLFIWNVFAIVCSVCHQFWWFQYEINLLSSAMHKLCKPLISNTHVTRKKTYNGKVPYYGLKLHFPTLTSNIFPLKHPTTYILASI